MIVKKWRVFTYFIILIISSVLFMNTVAILSQTATPIPRPASVTYEADVPPCKVFQVVTPRAFARNQPGNRQHIVQAFDQDRFICVRARYNHSHWWVIDLDETNPRFDDTAYMPEGEIMPVLAEATPQPGPIVPIFSLTY